MKTILTKTIIVNDIELNFTYNKITKELSLNNTKLVTVQNIKRNSHLIEYLLNLFETAEMNLLYTFEGVCNEWGIYEPDDIIEAKEIYDIAETFITLLKTQLYGETTEPYSTDLLCDIVQALETLNPTDL